jgi:hypothetical protein
MKSAIFTFTLIILFLTGYSQIPTRTIDDNKGTFFTVAKNVPPEMKFLMGSYVNNISQNTINELVILNADGTGVTKDYKNDKREINFWFESTVEGFIAKKKLPNGNWVVNIIVENQPGKSYDVKGIEINDKKNSADIWGLNKIIAFYEKDFNSISDIGVLAPTKRDAIALAADVGSKAKVPVQENIYYEYTYEKRLLQLAGVDVVVDSEETITKKVKSYWNRYKKRFIGNTVGFGLQNGNLLKFALSQNLPEVVETLASTYECDINFIDPADGLNLLDYINSEITRMKKQNNSEGTVAIYEKYKSGVIGLGGKPSK